jgi:hypothetical protein
MKFGNEDIWKICQKQIYLKSDKNNRCLIRRSMYIYHIWVLLGMKIVSENSLMFIPCIIRHVRRTNNPAHRSRNHTLYDISTVRFFISSNLGGSNKLPDDGRLLPKHVGASAWNKAAVQISAYCWSLWMFQRTVTEQIKTYFVFRNFFQKIVPFII